MHTVGELLPGGYDRYLRIFHPLTSPDGDRQTWREVFEGAGLVFHAEVQMPSLGWGRGYQTDEGRLEPRTRTRLLDALGLQPGHKIVFFFGLAPVARGGGPLAYLAPPGQAEAVIAEATAASPLPELGRPLPIEGMWPLDRTWVSISDYDLHATYVAASSEAAVRIAADPEIETLEVNRSTRVDWGADLINAARP